MTSSKSTKSVSMADLLAKAKFKIKAYSLGDRIKAKVVAKNPNSLILDISGKSEGIVSEKAFIEARDLIRDLKIGDEVTATVLIPETKEGNTLLSLRQAAREAVWGKLEKFKEESKGIDVKGRSALPSGVTVEFGGILGFIPSSQVGRQYSDNLEELVGKNFKAKIIEINKNSNKVVLSERMVSEEGEMKLNKEALEKIKEGEIYEGTVTTVTNFGCFVKLELGKDLDVEGLVHISEISWEKVVRVADILRKGDNVKVKVLSQRDGKLSLSIRHAQKDPWTEADKKYQQETKFKGKVVKLSDFGVFVQIEPGLEGLVHITKIPPATKLRVGDEVNCYIEEIDTKERKISLGLVLTTKPVGYK